MAKLMDITRSVLCVMLVLVVLIHELVDGRMIEKASNNAIIKIIKGDNGEIFDCYDVYKQPALNNPLFHNHKIQMKPSSYPKGFYNPETTNYTQSWHKYGTCPKGTVPIIRSNKNYNAKTELSDKSFAPNNGHMYRRINEEVTDPSEYAMVTLQGEFRGAQAKINIWKPETEPGEYSAASISVIADDGAEAISAGWRVYSDMYGDNEPRFFVAWTADRFQKTGCDDIKCPDFVLVSSTVAIGSRFDPTSILMGSQYDATFTIFQDESTGNWWIQYQGVNVGYFPSSIFKLLSVKATRLDFGGQIANTKKQSHHTSTDMGSGHLPSEGNFGVSSYFQQVTAIDLNHIARVPGRTSQTKTVIPSATRPNCYGVHVDDYREELGYTFYYGGPGYSSTCQ